MALFHVCNIPAPTDNRSEIEYAVDGDRIKIVARRRDRDYGMQETVIFEDTFPDHLATDLRTLRIMFAARLAWCIKDARDIGYEQAKSEIRRVLGIPNSTGLPL
jgi:hypothetical protein